MIEINMPAQPPWINGGRIPSLDGLRGLAIAMVTICHLPAIDGADGLASLRPILIRGNLGVDVFFVLSGFLITHLLLVEESTRGAISLKEFYWRRAFRIFPAYYFFLAIVAILALAGMMNMSAMSWAASLSYNVDLMQNPAPYAIGHLWSLGVEEKFYLLWPGVLVLLSRRRAILTLVACLLICPVARFVCWEYFRDYVDPDLFFVTRLDTIAIGCLLAYFVRSEVANKLTGRVQYPSVIMVASTAIVVLSVCVLRHSGKYSLGPGRAVEALAIAGIIFIATTHPKSAAASVFNTKPLMYVGALSYSLYLAQSFLQLNWQSSPAMKVVLAVAYALTSYYAIERPFLRLKEVVVPPYKKQAKSA